MVLNKWIQSRRKHFAFALRQAGSDLDVQSFHRMGEPLNDRVYCLHQLLKTSLEADRNIEQVVAPIPYLPIVRSCANSNEVAIDLLHPKFIVIGSGSYPSC